MDKTLISFTPWGLFFVPTEPTFIYYYPDITITALLPFNGGRAISIGGIVDEEDVWSEIEEDGVVDGEGGQVCACEACGYCVVTVGEGKKFAVLYKDHTILGPESPSVTHTAINCFHGRRRFRRIARFQVKLNKAYNKRPSPFKIICTLCKGHFKTGGHYFILIKFIYELIYLYVPNFQ